ncbi:MAG: cysteine synthase A [Candidatus Methanomethylophilaceae archaeon]|nr:cysteine synthase A [Candidatus Methanomethylophilaceae archaeon]
MTVYADITETIGETPLVRLNRIAPAGSEIYVKIERGNPGGSIKDRAVLSMINDAEARGVLKKGGTIVEPTSGNTGISIALIAAARGYKAVIIMPDTMSKERISSMRAYGAEVILSPGSKGMAGAVELANQIAKERDGFVIDQFGNLMNTAAHRTGTGREILRDIPDVDLVFAGFGTGGTASGIALAFQDAGAKGKVIGVEPAESPLISEGHAGPHKIQGIGANFVPGNLNKDILGGIVTVRGEDAIATTVALAREEGIFCGISSGANVFAAIREAKENPGKKIVAILPDGGEKYMSLGIFD